MGALGPYAAQSVDFADAVVALEDPLALTVKDLGAEGETLRRELREELQRVG